MLHQYLADAFSAQPEGSTDVGIAIADPVCAADRCIALRLRQGGDVHLRGQAPIDARTTDLEALSDLCGPKALLA